MKSTYRLLSIFVDGVDIPCDKPDVYEADCNNIFDLYSEETLLDFIVNERKIAGSMLLSCENKDDLESKIQMAGKCDKLWIVLDYYSGMEAADMLYIKRTLQVMTIIQSMYPRLNIAFTASENHEKFRAQMNKVYEDLN